MKSYIEDSIVDRNYLETFYDRILSKGGVLKESLQQGGNKNFIIQSSGGSSGLDPIVIPRSFSDIKDIYQRVVKYYIEENNNLPKKIALFGGVSHTEAALKLEVEGVEIKSFSFDQLEQLTKYNPDFLSCYPSVIREIIENNNICLNGLKGIKLGGERVFSSDVEKIYNKYKVSVIEQVGSTEMPAVALKHHKKGKFCRYYDLQIGRFEFFFESRDGWCDLVVKDIFPDLLFPIDLPFFTGDEVFLKEGKISSVRRKDDVVNDFFPLLEDLLIDCQNVQLDLKSNIIYYISSSCLPEAIKYKDVFYRTQKTNKLFRIPSSNKMPFIVA